MIEEVLFTLQDNVEIIISRAFLSFLVCFVIFANALASRAPKSISTFSLKKLDYWYTYITNPIEAILYEVKYRKTAIEEQHTIPQMFNEDDDYIVYWTRSNHSVSDRWRNKPGLVDWPSKLTLRFLTFNNKKARENLSRAYLMGTHGIKYSVLFHRYRKDESKFIFLKLDGVSNLLYGITWLMNTPQKLGNRLAYIADSQETNYLYLIDVLIGIPVFVIELVVAIICTVLGVIFGTFFHPLTTLFALLGGVYLFFISAFVAIKDLIIIALLVVLLVALYFGKDILSLPFHIISALIS